MLTPTDLSVVRAFAELLIREARESCQLDGVNDIRTYALQTVALETDRQCQTEVSDALYLAVMTANV